MTAKIFPFPVSDRLRVVELPETLTLRQRCLAAMRFLLNSMQFGAARPNKMFVLYVDESNDDVCYLNIGFSHNDLKTTTAAVLDYANRQPPKEWDW